MFYMTLKKESNLLIFLLIRNCSDALFRSILQKNFEPLHNVYFYITLPFYVQII